MKTLYDLLGVRRQATLIEIEQGYRRHLNRHFAGNVRGKLRKKDQLRLQSVRNAFLLLSSPLRRQTYDRELTMREQRRDRMLDIGGVILAVTSLLTGLALIAGSAYVQVDDTQTVRQSQPGVAPPAQQSLPRQARRG